MALHCTLCLFHLFLEARGVPDAAGGGATKARAVSWPQELNPIQVEPILILANSPFFFFFFLEFLNFFLWGKRWGWMNMRITTGALEMEVPKS